MAIIREILYDNYVDILTEPRIGTFVKRTQQPVFAERASTVFKDKVNHEVDPIYSVSREAILSSIPKLQERLGILHPGITKDEVKMFCNFYFGVFGHESSLNEGGSNMEHSKKVELAQLQLVRSHSVLYASLGGSSENYAQKVLNSVAAHEAVVRADSGKRTENYAGGLDAGIRSFIAISKYFYENGFDIFIPDYSGDSEEVREWDVEHAVDGMAVKIDKDGKPIVLLFDAKGQRYYPTSDIYERRGERTDTDFNTIKVSKFEIDEFPDSLKNSLKFYYPDDKFDSVYRARIVIPTGKDYLSTFQSAYKNRTSDNPSEILSQYARMSPYVKEDLDKKLNKFLILNKLEAIM